MTVGTIPIGFSSASAFALAEMPRSTDLERGRHVRFLVVSGRQDDGFWGPVGALWLSEDRRRCGFLVHPYAYHCLWSLGFRSGEMRVLLHGLFGCLFSGALTAKVLVVGTPKMPKRRCSAAWCSRR